MKFIGAQRRKEYFDLTSKIAEVRDQQQEIFNLQANE